MKFILLFLMVFAAFSTTRAAEGDKEAALREMREARIASVLKNKIPIRETPPGIVLSNYAGVYTFENTKIGRITMTLVEGKLKITNEKDYSARDHLFVAPDVLKFVWVSGSTEFVLKFKKDENGKVNGKVELTAYEYGSGPLIPGLPDRKAEAVYSGKKH